MTLNDLLLQYPRGTFRCYLFPILYDKILESNILVVRSKSMKGTNFHEDELRINRSFYPKNIIFDTKYVKPGKVELIPNVFF